MSVKDVLKRLGRLKEDKKADPEVIKKLEGDLEVIEEKFCPISRSRTS